jgi:hypothetical protein
MLRDSSAEMILLLITIQMHCQPLQNDASPYTELYDKAKRCQFYMEAQNFISLKLLQASTLIALYEISNAIYPAAYTTIAHCARLGHAMGIRKHKKGTQMFPKASKSLLNVTLDFYPHL